jgi:hypothetical protein
MGYLQTLLLCVLAASQSAAHFLLNYPPTIGMIPHLAMNDLGIDSPGFADDLESTAPCGSFTPDFSADNVTDFG